MTYKVTSSERLRPSGVANGIAYEISEFDENMTNNSADNNDEPNEDNSTSNESWKYKEEENVSEQEE